MALPRMEWIPSVQWLLPGTCLPMLLSHLPHEEFFLVKVCARADIVGE